MQIIDQIMFGIYLNIFYDKKIWITFWELFLSTASMAFLQKSEEDIEDTYLTEDSLESSQDEDNRLRQGYKIMDTDYYS